MIASENIRISPLAGKLCRRLGIDPRSLVGTGPHGRIMAEDVRRPATSSKPGESCLPIPCFEPDGEQGEYAIFRFSADMAQLAAMSTPIAVQCERLTGGRYSLFDYIARAVVKAATSFGSLSGQEKEINLRLVENKGELKIDIPDAARKSVRRLAAAAREPMVFSVGDAPDAVICDSGTPDEQLASLLADSPAVLVSLGGTSPKVGIECGKPVSKLILPLTLYCRRTATDTGVLGRIAMELKTLLQNPVVLLLMN